MNEWRSSRCPQCSRQLKQRCPEEPHFHPHSSCQSISSSLPQRGTPTSEMILTSSQKDRGNPRAKRDKRLHTGLDLRTGFAPCLRAPVGPGNRSYWDRVPPCLLFDIDHTQNSHVPESPPKIFFGDLQMQTPKGPDLMLGSGSQWWASGVPALYWTNGKCLIIIFKEGKWQHHLEVTAVKLRNWVSCRVAGRCSPSTTNDVRWQYGQTAGSCFILPFSDQALASDLGYCFLSFLIQPFLVFCWLKKYAF